MMLDPLELPLQVLGRHLTWMLRTELCIQTALAECMLNH